MAYTYSHSVLNLADKKCDFNKVYLFMYILGFSQMLHMYQQAKLDNNLHFAYNDEL